MKMEMKMKNWIKTVCFLLWTCVMCTACIDDDMMWRKVLLIYKQERAFLFSLW